MPTLPRLNLIGPGKVGLALALAWHRAGAVHVAGVLASSADKAQAAVSWLGAGSAVAEAAQLPPAEFTLIATPDGKIADMAARLAAANVTPAGAVVWVARACATRSPPAILVCVAVGQSSKGSTKCRRLSKLKTRPTI